MQVLAVVLGAPVAAYFLTAPLGPGMLIENVPSNRRNLMNWRPSPRPRPRPNKPTVR